MSGKTAAADTSITAETDANGRALLVLSAGDWTVRAEQNGQTVSKTIAVGDGQLGQKLTVPLSLSAGQTYTLDGTYERAGDYGALAELLDARGNTVAVSDQRGERAAAFHLEAPAGSYTLVLSKPGHLKLTVTDLELKENLRINSASALSLIPGDVRADANERIDFLDIAAMSGAFAGQFRIWDVPDIDGDGFFTVKDMTYVRENYGRTAQTLSFPDLQQ